MKLIIISKTLNMNKVILSCVIDLISGGSCMSGKITEEHAIERRGAEDELDDGVSFEEKFEALKAQLEE